MTRADLAAYARDVAHHLSALADARLYAIRAGHVSPAAANTIADSREAAAASLDAMGAAPGLEWPLPGGDPAGSAAWVRAAVEGYLRDAEMATELRAWAETIEGRVAA